MSNSNYCDFCEVQTDDDIKCVVTLASEIWLEYLPSLVSIEQIEYMLEKFQSYDVIKKQVEDKSCVYRILKCEGEPAGYFCTCKGLEQDEFLFLRFLYIKKDHRGKGLGRLIFNEIKKNAVDLNLPTIRLCVDKNNENSVKAYEKWGFRIVGSIAQDIGQNFAWDNYIMEFKLQQI